MTNIERIREMSEGELSEFLCEIRLHIQSQRNDLLAERRKRGNMKVKVKKHNDPNEQLQKCLFFACCDGACEWCETQDYSEACVPMLHQRIAAQRVAIESLKKELTEAKQPASSCKWCEDSAGMVVTVISQLKDGITSGIVGGNWTAEFCPFCGRKLEE